MRHHIKALTLAGSDSGGGAGIQADIKTFSALGCFGMSVITTVTAQNTLGVQKVFDLPTDHIREQYLSVIEDIGIDVLKIGMLHTVSIINEVSSLIQTLKGKVPIVIDPVMVAKGGHPLLQEEAIKALRIKIIPYGMVVTPNMPEASALLGRNVVNKNEMEQAARDILKMGAQAVLIKGGHLPNTQDRADCLVTNDKAGALWLESPYIETCNTHGTGCTFSAALASYLGHKKTLPEAFKLSKDYVSQAIRSGAEFRIGRGHGPLNHFFNIN